jgi:hypothetical protein
MMRGGVTAEAAMGAGVPAYLRGMARALAMTSCALLAPGPAAGRAQDPAQEPTVAPLVITPMVPVPQVGEGAPLYSLPELRAMQSEAQRQVAESRDAIRRCTPNARLAIPPLRGDMTVAELDNIAAAAAKNGGRILLPRPLTGPGGVPDIREAYASEGAAARLAQGMVIDAEKATLAAEQTRRAAATGGATAKAVEDAELVRQKAVNRLMTARAVFLEFQAQTKAVQRVLRAMGTDPTSPPLPTDVFLNPDQRYQNGMPQITVPKEYADLSLQKVVVRERQGKDGPFLLVTGEIHNTRARAIGTPPLSVTVLDRFGSPLKTDIAQPVRAPRIKPGEFSPFAYEVRPPPRDASTVVVTFGTNAYAEWRLPVGQFC